MAAQPPRRLPAGRLGQSSTPLSSSTNYPEPFYSDDDIELLHDIVALGETILPTLPERVRLPTNALFQAAEQVLPDHGYDADDTPAHIARFIFQLGGIRSQESLYDKFESLLGELGIALAFDDSGSRDGHSVEQHLPPRSSAGHGSQSGPANPVRLTVRRRGSLPEHTDRVSLLESPSRGLGLQIGTRLSTGQDGDNDHLRALQEVEENALDYTDYPPARPNMPETRDSHGELDDDLTHDGPASGSHEETEDDINHDPPVSASPGPPEASLNGHVDDQGNYSHDEASQDDFTLNDESMDDVDLPKEAFSGNEDIAARRQPEAQPIHQSNLPFRSAPSRAEIAELEAKALAFQRFHDAEPVSILVDMWHEKTLEKQALDEDEEEFADRCDKLESTGAAFLDWAGRATTARNERVGTDDYDAWVAKNERLASRAYDLHAMFNTVECLSAHAKDEAERTAVARRHVLRKRLFEGWSQQHIEDEAKIKKFALSEAVDRWGEATLTRQVRNTAIDQQRDAKDMRNFVNTMLSVFKHRLSDYMYVYNSREDAVATWQAQKQEADNEAEVASFCEARVSLIDAVNTWRDKLRDIVGPTAETGSEAVESVTDDLEDDPEDDPEAEVEEVEDQEDDNIGPEGAGPPSVENRYQRYYDTPEEGPQPADLETRLQHYNEQRDEEVKRQFVLALQQNVQNVASRNEHADNDCLKEPLDEWNRETKLSTFTRTQNARDQAEAVHTLALAERENWYARETRQADLQDAVDAWRGAMETSRQTAERENANANMVSGYYRKANAIEYWLEQVDDLEVSRRNAVTVDLYRAAGPVVSAWRARSREEFFGNHNLGQVADNNCALDDAQTTTATWRRVAREKYTRNIAALYRDTRRKEKKAAAIRTLIQWQHAKGRIAALDGIARYQRESAQWKAAQEGIEDWQAYANNAKVLGEAADMAFLEVHIDEWRTRAMELYQNKQDAADYDEEQKCSQALAAWERKTLELDGPKHTVDKVQERNDQRTVREAVDTWHHQAVPDAPSYRTSIAARRSVRQSMRASTSAEPPAQPAPVPEFNDFDDEPLDVTDLVASTPIRRSAMAPYRSTTTTPSAILASPAERELRRTYGDRRVAFADITEEDEY